MSTWVLSQGNLDWLDHPAFNWVNTMIGNEKLAAGQLPYARAKHLSRHGILLRFNHRFDLKSMLVGWGMSRGKPSDAISALEAG